MLNTSKIFLILISIAAGSIACATQSGSQSNSSGPNTAVTSQNAATKPAATPSNKFTPADIAKLKWIEGTWRGMDGDKPFYERYKFEDTTMVVESLKEDGSPDGEPGRFELKNGEFGQGEGEKRSAASEIGDSFVQFVPAVAGKGNNYRFERQSDGTWIAILEWTASANKSAQQKVYKMERWEPKK